MSNFLWGVIIVLLAALFVLIAVLQRKHAKKDYERAAQLYRAKVSMKIVDVEETAMDTQAYTEDGAARRGKDKIYLPTYEYTVDGRTYRYKSHVSVSSRRDAGRSVTGYYNPENPELITEEKPRRNIFTGFLWFVLAAFSLFFAALLFLGIIG